MSIPYQVSQSQPQITKNIQMQSSQWSLWEDSSRPLPCILNYRTQLSRERCDNKPPLCPRGWLYLH
jgi:hypothetical protein